MRRCRARQAAPVEVPAQARIRLRRGTPPASERVVGPGISGHGFGRIDLGDPSAMAARPLLQASAGPTKAALEAKVKSLAKAQVEANVRRAGVPEGHRRRDGRLRLRGRRFSVRQGVGFAAWVGLVPSEHSSGESQCRGGITKAGNKHLRETGRGRVAFLQVGVARAEEGAAGQSVPPCAPPRQRGREAAGRQAARWTPPASAVERGQRRDSARAGVLVLGRGPHGGRRLGGRAADIAGSFPEPPSSTGVGPIRGFFRAAAKPHHAPTRQSTDTEGAGRSNEMHRRHARRANIKLPNGRRTRHALSNGDFRPR